jgi:chitodextrinase
MYNAALTQAQIQTETATPIGGSPPSDTDPPTAPSNLTATAISQSQINLTWTASTDTVGVTGYRVERCPGSTCSNFAEIATPAGATYNNSGLTAGATYRYRVRATDAAGNLSGYSNIATATTQGTPNTAPTAIISTPANGTLWKVGDTISFSGSATDAQDGTVATSGISWTLVQQYCPSGEACHSHTVQNFNGVASGSFVAPDHDYPSYLELTLTATDSGGLSDTETVRLDPRTVVLTFRAHPGLR